MSRLVALLVALAAACLFTCDAFAFTSSSMQTRALRSQSRRCMSSTETTVAEAVVDEASPKTFFDDSMQFRERKEISESIILLEKVNPTENPTESPLLNGVWEFLNMGGLTSPGLVVFQALKALPGGSLVSAGDVVLSISRDSPRVEATSTLKVHSRSSEKPATHSCEAFNMHHPRLPRIVIKQLSKLLFTPLRLKMQPFRALLSLSLCFSFRFAFA
jgi:hypothetical protein